MGSQYPALEWLSLRRDGESPALIADRAGVPIAAVKRATDPYGPFPRPARQLGRVVAPEAIVDARTARWVQLRRDGARVTEIAAREGVSHQIVSRTTLPHGPFPQPHPPKETVESWVKDRRKGIPAAAIAAAAGVSADVIRRDTRPHGPFPGGGARIPAGMLGLSGAARLAGIPPPRSSGGSSSASCHLPTSSPAPDACCGRRPHSRLGSRLHPCANAQRAEPNSSAPPATPFVAGGRHATPSAKPMSRDRRKGMCCRSCAGR